VLAVEDRVLFLSSLRGVILVAALGRGGTGPDGARAWSAAAPDRRAVLGHRSSTYGSARLARVVRDRLLLRRKRIFGVRDAREDHGGQRDGERESFLGLRYGPAS
jgi:hypothetical protein